MKHSLIGIVSVLLLASSLICSCAQTQQASPPDPLLYQKQIQARRALYEKHIKALMADQTLIKK